MSPQQQQALVDELIRDEGLRLEPYIDSVGKTTIGVGRNLTDVGISEREAMYLLENDINHVEVDVQKALPWVSALDPVRARAIYNLVFNMGISRVLAFKRTLASIQIGNYALAAEQLLQSKYAQQVGQRAVRIAKMLETGDVDEPSTH